MVNVWDTTNSTLKCSLLSSSVQKEQNQQQLSVPLTDLPSMVPLTRYTHEKKRHLSSSPVTAISVTPAILQTRHLKRRFCYSEWHKTKKNSVDPRPLFRAPRKRALCSRPSLVTNLNVHDARNCPWLLISTCTMLETVPGYWAQRALFWRPSLVTVLKVYCARDRPWLLL
jgi:hypothetical protein